MTPPVVVKDAYGLPLSATARYGNSGPAGGNTTFIKGSPYIQLGYIIHLLPNGLSSGGSIAEIDSDTGSLLSEGPQPTNLEATQKEGMSSRTLFAKKDGQTLQYFVTHLLSNEPSPSH